VAKSPVIRVTSDQENAGPSWLRSVDSLMAMTAVRKESLGKSLIRDSVTACGNGRDQEVLSQLRVRQGSDLTVTQHPASYGGLVQGGSQQRRLVLDGGHDVAACR
jgi:hypothetical protein